jgi:hypothetical protein
VRPAGVARSDRPGVQNRPRRSRSVVSGRAAGWAGAQGKTGVSVGLDGSTRSTCHRVCVWGREHCSAWLRRSASRIWGFWCLVRKLDIQSWPS